MRSEDREGGHGIHRERLGQRCRERLSEERYPALSFRTRREETALETLVCLSDEERWGPETATAIRGIDLMIKELLHVINGKQVLAIHGNDDSIPYLGHKDLQGMVQTNVDRCVKFGRTLGLYRTSKSEVARILE
jgi:hypothetical protein